MKICSIENCGKPHLSKGYCVAHYAKWKKYGFAEYIHKYPVRYCSVTDCKNIYFSRGYCSSHYNKMIRQNNSPCSVEGCNQPRVGRGYCQLHYQRFKLNGDPNKLIRNTRPPQICTIEGCNRKYTANGLCQTHYMKVYMSEKRKLVINHYSNGSMSCSCCGEKEFKFLDIDHINNNGSEHRKNGISSGFDLISWIIKNNFPPEFQILCSNCNVGKSRNGGICPHKSTDNT